ncbi:Planctomycete cytochrome C [Bremerella volcania]|uniref:Planctomycete cytochrome C n=1 Tax=Bremerella volcania TaxID=2527984 RepID=A0A518C8U0_9BACT|nr:DUF1553 domain-containing protein [Bremerella volcania]QDU75630.1 Planctomycete cytochrome C [Bremerella volcania]
MRSLRCHLLILAFGFVGIYATAHASEPVVLWDFGAEEETPLIAHGGVHRDVPGPRPPSYPDFEDTNTAVKFDGRGAYFSYDDPGHLSPFDFTNGDSITIEAWVNARDLKDNENLYIMGKGRTGNPEFAPDNQNWALRLRGVKGTARVSFLFATPGNGSGSHWHRWTTSDGFIARTGWHHVAVTYEFGKPESVQGWVDGKQLPGAWDMGGPTTVAPVVDDDSVWIGSALKGSASNSFRGYLDAVALHRVALDADTLKKRFHRVGEAPKPEPAPESMPKLGDLPADRVTVTFHEGMPSHTRWLDFDEDYPVEVTRWETSEFLTPRLPLRYDSWGIRDSWNAPVLVRMAADVNLPEGEQTFLLRARGLSRLWVDGKLVAKKGALQGSPSGEEPITPVADPPLPGHRIKQHRLHEETGIFRTTKQGTHRVVAETMAGGKKFRAEPGEFTVALLTPDGKQYQVLGPAESPDAPLPLTDEAFEGALQRIESSLASHDDRNRRAAAKSRNSFWENRHRLARQWVEANPGPAIPRQSATTNPIDTFLASRIEQAKAATQGTSPEEAKQFHSEVLPILRSECFRCHSEKDSGGLQLNSREMAVGGGYSGPAIVPGDATASEMMTRIRHEDADMRMPPTGKSLSAQQIKTLETWINDGAKWPELPLSAEETELAPIVGDAKFIRRAYLDTVGIIPTEDEVRAFLQDNSPDKRAKLVDRLLDDPRWADHWVSYWQDVLAENPTLINATLNASGPFRWFLHDALRDDKSLDRMVTELMMMRGSPEDGGSAGFAKAAQNDSPFAAKGHIVANAFLGIELQCARCHDSPYHSTTQEDLYSIAAMFARKSLSVPKSSSVPVAFFDSQDREPLIEVTLKPGQAVQPQWPFSDETGIEDSDALAAYLENEKDSRERLTALVTAPENERFAEVSVNRIWRRLVGAGIVEPPHDWEGTKPSHPELLKWLARDFVANGYSVKHTTRLIMNSDLYQREAAGNQQDADSTRRLFNAPQRRRMTAEQIVDSFYGAAGKEIDVEMLTLDPDGRRPASNRNNLGCVERAWMLASISNERDRPSLTLPRVSVIDDVMVAFGWSAERQIPRTDRETEPNVLQPAVIANGTMTVWLTRASHESPLADLAVEAKSPERLVDSVFLRFLSRMPSEQERALFADVLRDGFEERLVPKDQVKEPEPLERLPQVTWSNHLRSDANTIQQEHARRARVGPPADPRLQPKWREVYEDMVWSVVNLREFVWIP